MTVRLSFSLAISARKRISYALNSSSRSSSLPGPAATGSAYRVHSRIQSTSKAE
ncbi:hypothetical protein [Actinoplanes sp. NPDC051494]|uniref:hypothetical protein n=1 Tax=Actinoplanes sp. NPDC051494 TaxID=3363907 RepID=UPI00379AFE9B